MSDVPVSGTLITLTPPEIWQATTDFRWYERSEPLETVNGEVVASERVRTLQQRWVRMWTAGEEWRDVPTVEG